MKFEEWFRQQFGDLSTKPNRAARKAWDVTEEVKDDLG